jgi:hypothetical protein
MRPCFYMDSKGHFCEISCLLGVSHPFANSHPSESSHPLWTKCIHPSPHAHQPSSLGLAQPILGHAPFFLCPSLMMMVVTPRGCADVVVPPLRCTHVAKGRWVQSLGKFPSCLILAQMQPKSSSIIIRKVKCVPPWCHMSPSCAQDAPAHTQTSLFSQSITSSLCSLFVPSLNLPKERTCSVGVTRDLTSTIKCLMIFL